MPRKRSPSGSAVGPASRRASIHAGNAKSATGDGEEAPRSGARPARPRTSTQLPGEPSKKLREPTRKESHLRVHEALIASEVRYRRLFESAKDGILIVDAETGVVDDVSPFLTELLGYPREELVGKKLWDLGFLADVVASQANFAELREKKYVRYEDLPLETAGGRKIDVEFVSNVYLVDHHKVIQCNIRDVTERTRAEAERARHAAIVEGSEDAIFAKSLDGTILTWNQGAERLYGYTPAEAIGRPVAMLVPPDRAGEVDRMLRVIEGGGRVDHHETVRVKKDGTRLEVALSISALRDAAGTVLGAATIARDITERKRAEEALRESEARYRTLVENIPQKIFMKDRNLRWISINEKLARDFGLRPEEVVGKVNADLFPPELAAKYQRDDVRILETGKTEELEEMYMLEGRETWVNTIKTPVRDTNGEIVGVLGVFWDVTERKWAEKELRESEERFRSIFDKSNDGILVADATTRKFLFGNRAIYQMLGYTPEELVALGVSEIHPQKDLSAVMEAFDKLVRREIKMAPGLPVKRKDGSVFYADISSFPLQLEGGTRLIGIFRDITERKQAEEALRESEERFRRLTETMPDAVVVGQDGRNVYANSAAARLLRAAGPEELVGLEISRIVNPASYERARQQMQRALAGEMPPLFEDCLVRLDGSLVPVEIATSLLTWQGRPALQIVARDITERQRAAQALRASEERYRLIAENTADVIWTLDLATRRFTYMSPSVERLRGFSAEEVLAQPFGASLTPDSLRRVDTLLATALAAIAAWDQSARIGTVEAEMPTRNGGIVQTEIVATALTDASGRVTSVLGVTRDTTERKRAEKALRESETRYRSLFEQSPLGIYQTTPDGTILAANEALLWALGYSSLEELTARNLERDGYEPTNPRQEFKERIERDGEVIGFESAWLKKDGQVLAVRESARAVRDRDGTTLYYEGTIEDITAQRRGEDERRRLVAAIEQASETIVIMDTAGRIEYVNPAFERTTGYTREEAIGKKLTMLESGEHDDAYFATLWQTITQSETWQGHFVNRRKDGSLYEEEATISPIRDDGSRIVSFVEVKRDVTQEMALQAQLRQAQKIEAVGMLAGGVAHDFNNLLQAMLNHVELVRGKDADAEQRAATMAELEAEIRRGSGLTRQLLLFARRETAKPEQLDLNEVIGSAATFLRRLVRANVTFSVELADEPLPVTADRGQIDQVLMNLAVNAADAMPGGGRLTIRSGSQGREQVWFAADDTGSGIPVAIRERIFEPFFTTKSTGKGTGLGLSMVHGIVAQHHGRVEFRDLPEGGTSFRITLPRAGSGEHPEVVLPTVDAPSAPGGHGERVLVVEDEEGARQGLAEILRMLGYDVVAVGSGEEAGLLPSQPGFDVLLTDMMLPGIAGGDLARGLLDRWPELKVILMSGYAEDEAVRRGALTGRVRFLQKPFDMTSLAREIHAALGAPGT